MSSNGGITLSVDDQQAQVQGPHLSFDAAIAAVYNKQYNLNIPEFFCLYFSQFSCNACISEAPRLSQSPGQLKLGPRAEKTENIFFSCP
jgi:hypothetical protein